MNLLLNHKGFEEYLVTKKQIECIRNGVQYIFRFPNRYGASVIKHRGSYGHKDDLWELAVIKWFDDTKGCPMDWEVVYDTPITDDVLGCLTDEDVRKLLKLIKGL